MFEHVIKISHDFGTKISLC